MSSRLYTTSSRYVTHVTQTNNQISEFQTAKQNNFKLQEYVSAASHTRNYMAHNLLHDEVPGLPERVREDTRRQGGVRHWGAAQALHDPHCQHEIAEQCVHTHILAKKPLKLLDAEHVPGDGVRDGRQDPVHLTHGCFAVLDMTWWQPVPNVLAAVGSESE